MTKENQKNEKLNSEAKPEEFVRFAVDPENGGFMGHLPISSALVPQDTEENFTEFLEVITPDEMDNLLSRFFQKRRFNPKELFSDFYWHSIFFLNTIIDIVFVFYKKRFSEEWKEEYVPEKKQEKEVLFGKFNFDADELTPPERDKLTKEDIFANAKKERVQFKTLVMLSGRMFTAGSLRTFLTILGISISIGVIMFLVSFGYGLQRTVLQRITTEESLLSVVATLPNNALISQSQIDDIKDLKPVTDVSPLIEYSGNLEAEDIQIGISIFIVDKNYFRLAGLMSSRGSPVDLNEGDVVVSSAVAILLGINPEEVIGRDINLLPSLPVNYEGGIVDIEKIESKEVKSFRVLDIIDDESVAFTYVLIKEFKTISPDSFIEVKVKVRDDKSLDIIKEELINQGYIVSSISDTVEETRKIFRGVQMVLGFFGFIALIISAIGMLNIMTIVLLERTQEIGIMKAVGASGRDIWEIVIADAIIIGLLGGIGGAIIGVGTAKVFNFAFNILASRLGGESLEIFQMPPGFIGIIIVFSAVIGFATGVWPAIRASRISPLEAIRYK